MRASRANGTMVKAHVGTGPSAGGPSCGMTDSTTPLPPDEHHVRGPRRFRAVLAVLVLVVTGIGAYLLWPEPTLGDEASVDAALVTKTDLPGFIT